MVRLNTPSTTKHRPNTKPFITYVASVATIVQHTNWDRVHGQRRRRTGRLVHDVDVVKFWFRHFHQTVQIAPILFGKGSPVLQPPGGATRRRAVRRCRVGRVGRGGGGRTGRRGGSCITVASTVRVFQHPARHGRFAFLFAPLELVGQLLKTQKGSVQGVRRQCKIQRFVRAQPLRLVKRHGHTQFVRSRTHPQFAHHQVRNGLFPIGETSDRGTIGQLNLGQNLTGF
jgi:hypothetical protein